MSEKLFMKYSVSFVVAEELSIELPTARPVESQKQNGLLPTAVTFYYFELLGRGDPLTQLFTHHGQKFQKVALS